jgi:hypothetical protein
MLLISFDTAGIALASLLSGLCTNYWFTVWKEANPYSSLKKPELICRTRFCYQPRQCRALCAHSPSALKNALHDVEQYDDATLTAKYQKLLEKLQSPAALRKLSRIGRKDDWTI